MDSGFIRARSENGVNDNMLRERFQNGKSAMKEDEEEYRLVIIVNPGCSIQRPAA